jgi:OTT_1508-like deaminase
VVTDDGVGVIGAGKKCCWCCSQLAKQLNLAHPHISLQVPASHGLVFPWALPTIGISLGIAESLETALKEVWRREAGKFAEEFDKRSKGIQSAMSSPPGSISGDAPDIFALSMDT